MKYCIENINNSSYLHEDYLTIKQNKKNAIDKIKNLNDKKRVILGEQLLIKGLQKYYNVNYDDVNIRLNENGKPYISNDKYHHIKFNISHSHDYSICVFSSNEIGVDIEKIRKVDIKTINQFATTNEINYILSSENQIFRRLFTIYTLKESYFKMLGDNLNNIKNVEFQVDENIVSCSDPKTKFNIINTIDGYVISICERT